MAMGQGTLVPDAGEVVLDQLMVEGRSQLVMVLRPAGEGSVCPECRQASRRIHSRYCRRLNDLPWEGIPVRIELRVRRSFVRRKTVGTIYLLNVCRRLCSAMRGEDTKRNFKHAKRPWLNRANGFEGDGTGQGPTQGTIPSGSLQSN